MHIIAEPCDLDLVGLADTITHSLALTNDAPSPLAKLSLVGPFRSYYGNGATFGSSPVAAALVPSGWRALLTADGAPIAVVDLSGAGKATDAAVRPGDAGDAMFTALKFIAGLSEPGRYRARWLSFPHLFITGFMLRGRRFLFVPTRIGAGPRPEAMVMERAELIALVRSRQRRPTRRLVIPQPEAGQEAH